MEPILSPDPRSLAFHRILQCGGKDGSVTSSPRRNIRLFRGKNLGRANRRFCFGLRDLRPDRPRLPAPGLAAGATADPGAHRSAPAHDLRRDRGGARPAARPLRRRTPGAGNQGRAGARAHAEDEAELGRRALAIRQANEQWAQTAALLDETQAKLAQSLDFGEKTQAELIETREALAARTQELEQKNRDYADLGEAHRELENRAAELGRRFGEGRAPSSRIRRAPQKTVGEIRRGTSARRRFREGQSRSAPRPCGRGSRRKRRPCWRSARTAWRFPSRRSGKCWICARPSPGLANRSRIWTRAHD